MRGDIVYCDRDNHASIFDGCRLAFGVTKKFRHNDMDHLEELLAEGPDEAGKFVVVDGVFSMLGDLANLPRLVPLAERYGARVLVDEAHSIGVLGANGRGTVEHFGLEDRVDLVMGTFSKSFASIGGFIAGPESVIHFVKHHARPLIFSAATPPAAAAAVLAALDVLETQPDLRVRLRRNADRARAGLRALGYDTGDAETPIVPVVIGDRGRTFALWKALFEEGVFTNPVTSPAVPPGKDLIRTSYMATHTDVHLDAVLRGFEAAGKRLGLLERDGEAEVVRPARAQRARR